MQHFWASLIFLVSVYWPYMLGALLVGVVTGWLSLSKPKGVGVGNGQS